MFNPDTFYSVLTPMFYTTKLLGLTPFVIDGKYCKNSITDLLWSILFMLFINIYSFIGIDTDAIDNEIIAHVTSFLDTYVGQAGMCFGILFGCIFRNDIINAVKSIKAIDDNMKTFLHVNLTDEYRKSKIQAVKGVGIAIFVTAVTLYFSLNDNRNLISFELFGEFISYTGPYLINTFVDLQFCTLILCLKQRFNLLNKKISSITLNLQHYMVECDNFILYNKKKVNARPITHVVASGCIQDRALFLMEKIRINHYKLCTVSKLLNKAYSVQILFIVMQSFITIVVALYYSGRYSIIDNFIPVQYIIYSGVQLAVAVGQFLVLVISCANTAAEAKKAGPLIHRTIALTGRIENRCKDELQLEITFFSLQLLHQNVEFTACRVFVINETLIFSVVGAITTYLVIVIQFEAANFQRQK